MQELIRRHWGGPEQASNRIPRDYRWFALSVALVVMFTASLSSTIVSTAAPTIVADLDGFGRFGWIFSAYMLAATVSVPLAGQLSDTYGRRPLYLWGLAAFAAGSALAGLSTSMTWLIGARVVSGIGGGAMMALATATIGDIFSPRERGRWMGLVMSVFGLASIIGPTAGGAITDHLGWRWVFFLPLPLTAVAWVVAGAVLPRVRTGRRHRLDPAGSALLAGGLIALLLGFTWGGTRFAWASAEEVLLFALAGLLVAVFVAHERRTPAPLLSPALFRNRVFALSVCVSFLVVAAMYGALSFVPLFVQGVLGETAQSSGVVLTPLMLAFVGGSVVAGQIVSRTGRFKVQALIGVATIVVGFLLFTRLTASSGTGEVVRDMVVLGLGIGAAMPIFSMAVQSVFPHELLGTVNSARQLFANLGGAIAVPVMTSVVVRTFSDELPARVPPAARPLVAGRSLDPQTLLTPQAQSAARRHFAELPDGGVDAYRGFVAGVRGALASGIVDVFAIGAALGLVALVLTAFLPRVELATWDEDAQPAPEPAPVLAGAEERSRV